MKIKWLSMAAMLFLLFIELIFLKASFAGECGYSPTRPNRFFDGGAIMKVVGGPYWRPSSGQRSYTNFSQVINCATIAGDYPRYKHVVFNLNNSNVDWQQTIVISGKTYLKIINTGNAFLDQYGYVTFNLTYTGDFNPFRNLHVSENVAGIMSFLDYYTTIDSRREYPSQSLQILDLNFHFTAAPADYLSAQIALGVLELKIGMTSINNDHWGNAEYTINLSLMPEGSKTCEITIDPANVVLSMVHNSALRISGDEAGYSKFSVTAECANMPNNLIYYVLVDNVDITNNTNVLSNMDLSTSNVGIKVYDAVNNVPVTLNSENVFGTLSPSSTSSITRYFYAKYYKKDNLPVNAGRVISQANILVVYK